MARTGRPRANLEQKIFAEMSEHDKKLEEIVGRKIDLNKPYIMAFEAACLLLAIERGADSESIRGKAPFRKIHLYARRKGPHGKWRLAREFLEAFVQRHAPGWDWQKEARQTEAEDLNYARENKSIAKGLAEDARWRMARTRKFFTPSAPDANLLFGLAWEYGYKKSSIRTTWPTLRELKLATAIPERVLRNVIRNLRPKKTEMTKEPKIVPLIFDASSRRFSRRGAVPLRYGPRLVIGVLNEFTNRLPGLSIDNEERKRLQKMATRVRQAFMGSASV